MSAIQLATDLPWARFGIRISRISIDGRLAA